MLPVLPAGASGAAAPATPAASAAPVAPGARSFAAALDRTVQATRAARALPPSEGARGPGPAAPPEALRLLRAVDRARVRLDAVLAAARAGRTFTAQEMLGLQIEAHRTAETVDLASKLVESGAQSVRQALNTQV